mgnify:CR=1 FL=1
MVIGWCNHALKIPEQLLSQFNYSARFRYKWPEFQIKNRGFIWKHCNGCENLRISLKAGGVCYLETHLSNIEHRNIACRMTSGIWRGAGNELILGPNWDSFWDHFGALLGGPSAPPFEQKHKGNKWFWSFSDTSFGSSFGPFWDPFWLHFGLISGSILSHFGIIFGSIFGTFWSPFWDLALAGSRVIFAF